MSMVALAMASFYLRVFRSVYRFLLAVNGPQERHEIVAGAVLSLFLVMNLTTASLLSKRWLGHDWLHDYDTRVLLASFAIAFLGQYLLILRRPDAMAFVRKDGLVDVSANLATVSYMAGSIVALFLASPGSA